MSIQDKKQQDCCGCSACASICKHDAITMVPDRLGFKYPVVDSSKCVECGLCEKNCAFDDRYGTSNNYAQPIPFGARHKDESELISSRSGAAFIALSDCILSQGGVVYGAGYAEHFKVVHKRAGTKLECKEFKGSKYVQSDLDGIFPQVHKDLQAGLKVLFSGTTCQVAGLKSYIGKRWSDNLYLVDIICHGVPSPYIWRDYVDYLERKTNHKIKSVDFRDKKNYGWRAHHASFNIGDSYISPYTYTYAFYKHIMLRKSCAECPYCNLNRPSDITLGDFWGWEKTDPKFNQDDKGVSLVLCNTPKGFDLFNKISCDLEVRSAKLENCMQIHLSRPTTPHPLRNKFEEDYSNSGFEYVLKKYLTESFVEYVRRKLGAFKRYILKC